MKRNGKYIKFIELRTEEEPLYLYEIYKNNPEDRVNSDVPVTIEFFTQEEGIRNYLSLEFLDRKCKYTTQHYTIFGEFVEDYTKELSPFEFLEKVGPYIQNEELRKRKAQEVLLSMQYKAAHQEENDFRKVRMNKTDMPMNQLDEAAGVILTKYMKVEP